MITLARLEQTCTACPAQWDAWDTDGTYYYIRYRSGFLRVSKGAVFGEDIFAEAIGDGLDGFINTEDMLRITDMALVAA